MTYSSFVCKLVYINYSIAQVLKAEGIEEHFELVGLSIDAFDKNKMPNVKASLDSQCQRLICSCIAVDRRMVSLRGL